MELGYSSESSKLHNDLIKLEKDFPEYSGYFSAVKFLGNEAVHGSNIGKSDLLDSMEVLLHTLELFDKKVVKQRLSELARNLEKKYDRKRKSIS
ncbi:hypothetical protein [Pseudoalteromonas sp. MSK9-3]|uniref:hypothetical protein n=1 Tax=Pseudoalteromonas sp. MSK9-3 TaxID=1897633 RepID=UPI0016032622|nr:hypothetical protein [Pseudoalteromonas sp. MSK9-3]